MRELLLQFLRRLTFPDIYNFIQAARIHYEAYHDLEFHFVYERIKLLPKAKQIDIFVKFYSFLPEQGSYMWLQGRQLGIGGSEMSVITGQNQYKDMRNLIAGKVKLPEGRFDGSIATRWGNIFEPILDMYVSLMLNTVVHETGSIPGVIRRANGKPIQNYSPDGVCLVKKTDYKRLIDRTSQKYKDLQISACREFRELPDELILLMEYKNPYRRVPNGSIKEHYLSQPKAGMCTIPITDAALFVDGVFRKCSIRDFNLERSYDVKFHCIHGKCRRLTYQTAIACGFVGIMDTAKPFATDGTIDAYNSDSDWGYSEGGDSSEDDLSDSHSFEDEILPRISKEEILEIAKQLAKFCKNEIKQPNSDFTNLRFDLAHFPSVVRLLLAFFHNMTELSQYEFTDIMFDDELDILAVATKQLFIYQMVKDDGEKNIDKKKLRLYVDIAREMLPDIIEQFTYKAPEYDLADLPFGEDFGETNVSYPTGDDFEAVAEKLVNDRFADEGYKMYYPQKIFFDVESEDAERLMHGNYIDYTKDQDTSARKWLYFTVKEFVEHCRQQDVRPVGIIPWKMFEVCFMPMFKDPDFLSRHEEKIRETIDIIDEIQNSCDADDVEGKMKILAKYYKPPRAKKTRAKKAKSAVSNINGGKKVKNNFDQETEDFFSAFT